MVITIILNTLSEFLTLSHKLYFTAALSREHKKYFQRKCPQYSEFHETVTLANIPLFNPNIQRNTCNEKENDFAETGSGKFRGLRHM